MTDAENKITVSACVVINEELHDWLVDTLDSLLGQCSRDVDSARFEAFSSALESIAEGKYESASGEIMVLLMLRAGFCHIDRRGTFSAWEDIFR